MAQQTLAARPGYATGTQCAIVVASLTNGAATLTCSGSASSPYTITWTATDSDNGATSPAGYVSTVTVTGLTAFTNYSYTVTQGANQITGSFYTVPAATNDFSMFFASCDLNWGDSANAYTLHGFYDKMKIYAQTGALPTVGLIHVGDHYGYVDTLQVNDTAGTGKVATGVPSTTHKEYDFSLSYLCALGLLGDTSKLSITWGHDSDRLWCYRNINCIPQWGDHEFANDIGYSSVASTNLNWTPGKNVYNKFLGPLQPSLLNGANSNAWSCVYGPLKIIAPDFITNGDGAGSATVRGASPGAVCLGASQISDLKTALGSDEQFKILCNEYGIRELETPTNATARNRSGTQQPLYDYYLAEFKSLFTDSSTASIMNSLTTNGIAGVTAILHADYHRANVVKHYAAAYAGNKAEYFYEVSVGTINGSSNMGVSGETGMGGTKTIQTGLDFNSQSYVEYFAETTFTNDAYWGCRIDVYGSKNPKEMHIILMDSTGAELFHGRWLARSSNSPFPTTWTHPQVKSTKKPR